jgi:dTDP-glucose 4,6-dehydratase
LYDYSDHKGKMSWGVNFPLKVMVTGGAGFIGSHFVEMFTLGVFPEISEIVIIDSLTYAGKLSNMEQSLKDERVTFFHGDIRDFEFVSVHCKDVQAIVNFAAESHVDRSIGDSMSFVSTNVLGTQILLEAARVNRVSRFIQVSTDEVYGSLDEGSWDESSPLLPNSPYAASKAAADLLVRSYFVTHGLQVNVTRCSNNYGSRQYPEKIIPFFVSRLLAGKKVTIYGDGTNVRDWLHVSDHCQGIYLVLSQGKPGEIYNIGGGIELTNLQLVDIILDVLNFDQDRIEFVQDRLGHDRRYSVNWQKISHLGYAPSKKLDSEMSRTVKWYQENPKALEL